MKAFSCGLADHEALGLLANGEGNVFRKGAF